MLALALQLGGVTVRSSVALTHQGRTTGAGRFVREDSSGADYPYRGEMLPVESGEADPV